MAQVAILTGDAEGFCHAIGEALVQIVVFVRLFDPASAV